MTARREPIPAAMSCQDVTRLEHEKAERDARFRDEALRWLPDVTRYALSLTRDETNAEDLVQETFLRAYRA
jgi:DNA-directed RNA polymerase specialized sigma24 family protein